MLDDRGDARSLHFGFASFDHFTHTALALTGVQGVDGVANSILNFFLVRKIESSKLGIRVSEGGEVLDLRRIPVGLNTVPEGGKICDFMRSDI